MRAFLISACLLLPLAAAAQGIYRWVDKNGVVHYSDSPDSPDAKLIDVIEPNTYEGETPTYGAASEAGADEDRPAVAPYDSLSIVSPTPDQVFFGADATVNVALELDGTLRPDHSVVFFVNGNRHAADGLGLQLSNLARGTYFLRGSILDQNGNPVISSQQTTFHVRQPSIFSPQSPQAPRRRTPAAPANPPGG